MIDALIMDTFLLLMIHSQILQKDFTYLKKLEMTIHTPMGFWKK